MLTLSIFNAALMNKLQMSNKPLHRVWLRWLPYTAFGALLVSWRSSNNIQAIAVIYGLLMSFQIGVIAVYLLLRRSNKNQSDKIQ